MNAQTGLRFNVNQIPDHNKLVKFGEWVREPLGLDFDYARESQCRAVGSYLEDLTVYDKTGELIAYYDLVWWILASGSGLINDTF